MALGPRWCEDRRHRVRHERHGGGVRVRRVRAVRLWRRRRRRLLTGALHCPQSRAGLGLSTAVPQTQSQTHPRHNPRQDGRVHRVTTCYHCVGGFRAWTHRCRLPRPEKRRSRRRSTTEVATPLPSLLRRSGLRRSFVRPRVSALLLRLPALAGGLRCGSGSNSGGPPSLPSGRQP
jgi:hypothetical protein